MVGKNVEKALADAKAAGAGATAPNPNALIYALKERAPRAALVIAGAQATWPLIVRGRRWLRDRRVYTITVNSSDDIYYDLHEWVLGQLPRTEQRSLRAMSVSSEGDDRGLEAVMARVGRGAKEGTKPPTKRIRMHYDGTTVQTLRLDGHKIEVSVTEPEMQFQAGVRYVAKEPSIVFTVTSAEARDALHSKMEQLLYAHFHEDKRPLLRIGMSWGGWQHQADIPLRSMESVVLPKEQRERLVGDMGRFLKSEAEYNRRFIPWHRGYLFTGMAGTGKTSAAKALANHFGLDIWYLPLGDLRSGSNLMELVSGVAARSMLLIEDIDVFHAATTRDDDSEVSLSDLLNALDGVTTPHGLIYCMTSNHPEVLDEALIRPGRVDVRENFGLATNAEIKGLLRWFYPEWRGAHGPATSGGSMLAPAAVVGVMHEHSEDPEAAVAAIAEMRRRG